MARRGGSPSRGSAFGRGRSPSPSASRRPAPQPQQPAKAVAPQPTGQVAQQPTMAAPSAAGGFMANVASTAAGVAIGSTVGHALTGALMGGNHSEQQQAAVEPQAGQPQQYQQQQPMSNEQQDPCKFELDQFLSCAQSQSSDLALCDGFNQVLRECKNRYGNARMYQ